MLRFTVPDRLTTRDLVRAFPLLEQEGDLEIFGQILRRRQLIYQCASGEDASFIAIQLYNGFTLFLRAVIDGPEGVPLWTHPVREVATEFSGPNPFEAFVNAAQGRGRVRTRRVQLIRAMVELDSTNGYDVPPAHLVVEGSDLLTLIDEALQWCRATTGLPLAFARRVRAVDGRPSLQQSEEGSE